MTAVHALVLGLTLLTLIFVALKKNITRASFMSSKSLKGKTALVTGGTSGIGLEIAKDFAKRGARVIVASHRRSEGLTAITQIATVDNTEVVFKQLDLSSLRSVREFAKEILQSESHLHILVNNAGVCVEDNFISKDGMNYVMQVNYYGHFLLTLLLLPLLKRSGRDKEPAKIINMSSMAHRLSLSDVNAYNNSNHWWSSYCNSKLCLVLFARQLHNYFSAYNFHVVVNCADPGIVNTAIFKSRGDSLAKIVIFLILLFSRSPQMGAQPVVRLAVDGFVSGEYWVSSGRVLASRRARDEKNIQRLWLQSLRLVRLSHSELQEIFA
ncbi:unnamed protein product [Leptosia nina]|uniref:Retinol dehydrogenase 11 n=1 Tax=Leptosia nina TaxID=320188 RepID=A0AAV1IZJ6_9NEOP